jgi:hypothetical protein
MERVMQRGIEDADNFAGVATFLQSLKHEASQKQLALYVAEVSRSGFYGNTFAQSVGLFAIALE